MCKALHSISKARGKRNRAGWGEKVQGKKVANTILAK
jgi:hypothetical protein